MNVRGARSIPVRFAYAPAQARSEGWGRFTRLSANDAELLTYFKVERGDRLVLSFELPGERFEAVHARVARAPTDPDGYYAATVRFLGPMSQVRLGRVLLDLLSRQGA